jgi:hypothetical protein
MRVLTKCALEKNEGECAEGRVMSVAQFGAWSGLGKSKTYEEMKAGRLQALKCGARTLVTPEQRQNWLCSLPVFGAGAGQTAGKRKRAS